MKGSIRKKSKKMIAKVLIEKEDGGDRLQKLQTIDKVDMSLDFYVKFIIIIRL